MKKIIAITLLCFSTLMSCNFGYAQTVNLGTPNAAGLPVGIGGTYGFADVYVAVSPTKLSCLGGQPVFDNSCNSYAQDIDTSTWCKVSKLTGASNVIPFNNPTSNGFGINLFADGKPHQLLFIFYVQPGVWQNTRYANFTAPASSFAPPVCPNAAPTTLLDNYSGTMYAHTNNDKVNCPFSATIAKDGVTITPANVTALCGSGASILTQSFNTVLFNATNGGSYTATVVTSAGTGTSAPVVITGTSISSKGSKKK